jgi:uncharacterized protein YggE
MADVARRFGLLHVVGTGKTSATPDMVVVNFSVNVVAKTQEESTRLQAKKFSEVKQKLVRVGAIKGLDNHKNLCTTTYGFGAEYEYENSKFGQNKKKLVGFKTSQAVSLKLSLEGASAALDALASSETEIDGVNFMISNQAELRKQALDLAIKNAKENATNRAKDLGVEVDLANVYEYKENSGDGVGYSRGMKMSVLADSGGGESPDLAAGEMDVTVSVSVTYATEMMLGALKLSAF